MAILDSQAIFSRDQVISQGVSLSERYMDLQTLADYGVGRSAYVECIIGGTFSNFLRVQLIGCEDATWSKVQVIGDSGIYDKAELVAGKKFYVPFNITDTKYKNICLRFIASTDATTNDASAEISGGTTFTLPTDGYAAPPKVGEEKAEVANSISCHLVITPSTQVQYDYVNTDKETA